MKRSSAIAGTVALLLALLAVAGCRTPWVRGEIVECLPQYSEKCPRDVAFFVAAAKREARLKTELENALRARGLEVAEKQDECDVVVKVTVDSWEYNDVGFAGRGERNDIRLTLTLVDRRKQTILGRWRVVVSSDFRIIGKWAEKL